MSTFVFQLEIQMEDGQDMQPAIKQVLDSMVEHLSKAWTRGQDPPFRLNVVVVGMKDKVANE